MRIKSTLLLFVFFLTLSTLAQPLQRPKLIVGIVVDQMKFDYIYRYWDKLGDGGFKRLVREGYECSNTKYNYSPTYTGPGHASIYTGTTPSVHGIISNDWYDRNSHKTVYCVEDSMVKTVGASGSVGMMSPKNLITNTIGDELKLATNFKGKVIGIALKDRGAILPAGHAANAAYWFDNKSGNWISSTYYMQELPSWVNAFNAQKYPEQYSKQAWTTLLEISKYTESTADDTPYESPFKGESTPTFPHDFAKLGGKDYENVRRSPFGNTLTKDFAKAVITGEQLGTDEYMDMLCVSFSSTDYVGHQFGPNAIETEDCYLRLDKDLEDFLVFLDKNIGKKNVLLFLTADHGALQNPQFLADHKFNAGFLDPNAVEKLTKAYLQKTYQDTLLFEAMGDQCIYFNSEEAKIKKIDIELVAYDLSKELKLSEINRAYPAITFKTVTLDDNNMRFSQLSYFPKRSGDLYYSLVPNYFESSNKKGTTHGAPYNYDTHVPLFFYGFTISPGNTNAVVYITDIAATLSSILKIEFPNGSTGNPINFFTSK